LSPMRFLWSNFLKITYCTLPILVGSFFIDQEKKHAVIFDSSLSCGSVACIIGETGNLRTVDLGVAAVPYRQLPVCSYAPSLEQINQGQELPLIGQKKISRLSTSLFYIMLFVSFITFILFFDSVFF